MNKMQRRIDTIDSRYETPMMTTLQLGFATMGRMILQLMFLPNLIQAQAQWGVDPSNHYFCGLPTAGISTINNNCLSSQHCPSGSDNECEMPGEICYKNTKCDSTKGHGTYFDFLGLPYADSRNLLFCASRFAQPFPKENCTPKHWCKDMICPNNLHCFPVLECNIQDLVRAEIEKEGLVGVDGFSVDEHGDSISDNVNIEHNDEEETDDVPEIPEKIVLDANDPKRHNFCGRTWEEADKLCSIHCPKGTECSEPFSCYADTGCYFDKDLVPSATPTVTYDSVENMSFCGSCWSDAADNCSIEKHCPNGDSDCSASETCYTYLPGCNIVDLLKKAPSIPSQGGLGLENKPAYGPATPPTPPPSRQPTKHPVISIATQRTNPPTEWSIQWTEWTDNDPNEWVDNDQSEEEEDWSNSAVHESRLFCGKSLVEAANNCGKQIHHCPEGVCELKELKCFNVEDRSCGASNIISSIINKEDDGEVAAVGDPDDFLETFYCGTGPIDASACRQRCRTGKSEECPEGENCYGYIECSDTTRPPTRFPTQQPSRRPTNQPVNNIGMKQNYCARSKKGLETECINTLTCNKGEPPCPDGTYCWGDHLCTGVKKTDRPTILPTTKKPTMPPSQKSVNTKDNEQLGSFESPPELYCAFKEEELETTCHTAQSCSKYRCPDGMLCHPFTCKEETQPPLIVDDEGTFLCANSEAELDDKCGLATDCTGNAKVCQEDQVCLRYECKQDLDMCPLMYIGWHSSKDCIVYWHCSNGEAGTVKLCEAKLKFDKIRGECVSGELVNQNCYGPAITEEADTSYPSRAPTEPTPPIYDTLGQRWPENHNPLDYSSPKDESSPTATDSPISPSIESEIPPWLMENHVYSRGVLHLRSTYTLILSLLSAIVLCC